MDRDRGIWVLRRSEYGLVEGVNLLIIGVSFTPFGDCLSLKLSLVGGVIFIYEHATSIRRHDLQPMNSLG